MHALQTISETNKALADLEERFFDIPFENSDFQNDAFVVAAQITPERAYRAIGLRISSKLRALRGAYFEEQRTDIKLGELREKLESPDVSKWDKMRAQVDIDEIEASRPFQDKLKNDAIREIQCLYKHLEKMPHYTREQFEAGELQHFMERSKRQAVGIEGGRESIANITKDMPALAAYEAAVLEVAGDLEKLRSSMDNQLPQLSI